MSTSPARRPSPATTPARAPTPPLTTPCSISSGSRPGPCSSTWPAAPARSPFGPRRHAGFLDYTHHDRPADVVTTKSALHQLPHVFTQEALRRAAALLRPGGTFHLWDAIFSFDPADAVSELQRWVDAAGDTDGVTPEEFETHIRDEFSTYDWIIAGMLERAGLEIVEHHRPRPTHAEFRCQASRRGPAPS